jgi:hypothetical protein
MLWIIFAILLAASLSWLAIVMIRHTRELKAVRAVASTLSKDELDQIFDLIERIGTASCRGCIGIFGNVCEPNGHLRVMLPNDLADFPWGGKAVEVRAAAKKSMPPVEFDIHEPTARAEAGDEPTIRWLAVPAISVGQQKRVQNVFSHERYIRLSPALGDKLNKLYPKDSKLLLAQILSVDGLHTSSEPFDQMRCGLSAAWIQAPRFHKCPVCRRPMRLVLQVPGALLRTRIAEGCFYLFGCPSHADQIVTDEDWG